jgi:hypothetical protein
MEKSKSYRTPPNSRGWVHEEHFYNAAGWRAVDSAADGEIRFELSADATKEK